MFECLFLYVLGAKVFEGPIEKIHFSSKMVFVFFCTIYLDILIWKTQHQAPNRIWEIEH